MEEERRTSLERPEEDSEQEEDCQKWFEEAFKDNDDARVTIFLEEYRDLIDVNRVWNPENGATMLMHACKQNWTKMIYALGAHADWRKTSNGGCSPMHLVADTGDRNLVEFAVEHGGDLNVLDGKNQSPLMFASMSGSKETVSYFLTHDEMNMSLINLPEDKASQTCLWAAARNGSTEIVEDLIRHGAQVNQRTANGTTPIWIASQFGNTSTVEALIRNGGDPRIPNNEHETTPLHMACLGGHVETIKVLVRNGCDLMRATTDSSPWNGLHFAAQAGNKKVLQHFVETMKVDLASLSTVGETPLHRACLAGHEKCVRYLVRHGMRRTNVNDMGETASRVAGTEKHSKIAAFLRSIEDGTVSVDDLDWDGNIRGLSQDAAINRYVLCENPDVIPSRERLKEEETKFRTACNEQLAGGDGQVPDDATVERCVAPFRESIESGLDELVDKIKGVVDDCARDETAVAALREYEQSSADFAKFQSSKVIYRDAGRNEKSRHGAREWDECVGGLEIMADTMKKRRTCQNDDKTAIAQPHRDDIATLIAWCTWTQAKLNRWITNTSWGTTRAHEAKVKSLCRVAEKMGLYVGRRRARDPTIVWDYVRGMKTFPNLEHLSGFLLQMMDERSHPEIFVFKVKSRFHKEIDQADNPWQDVMIHFVFTDVPKEHRVICELQLTLENILFARKSMGGHEAYERFRNSSELRRAVTRRAR